MSLCLTASAVNHQLRFLVLPFSLLSSFFTLNLFHPFSSSSCYSNLRQTHSLNPLITLIKTQKCHPNPTLLRSSNFSSIPLPNPTKAFLSFAQLTLSDRLTDPTTSNSLLSALSSNGYLEFSQVVFDTMVFRKTPLSNVSLGVFFNGLSRVAELGKILSFLDTIQGRIDGIHGSIIAFSVVDGLCRASRFSDASQVLEELRCRDGFKPDFMAYRSVIEGFRSIGRVDEIVSISKRKRKLGVAPRMNEYGEYIFGLISEGQIWAARELGEAIVGGDFPVPDDILNALISSVSGIDPDQAISFLKYMVQKERFPTLSTLKEFSRNLCRSGKSDEIWDVFRVLDSKGFYLDLDRYKLTVSFLCEAGRVREAYSVLKEMRKNGYIPDVSMYNSVMEVCCREDLLRPAKKLWDEMFAYGCEGNLQTYRILIGKFLEGGEIEEANRLFHHMLDKGVQPDVLIYTSMVRGLCKQEKIDSACEVFNKSVQQDILLAEPALNELIFSVCKTGKFHVASKVMRGITASNIDSMKSHIILLKSLADAGEVEMAAKHIEWVQDTTPLNLGAMLGELVASLSSSLKPEPILQLLHVLKEQGLVSETDPWINLCKESLAW